MTKHTLEELRERIDELDRDIVKLLNQRMNLCQDIGALQIRGRSKRC